MSQERYPNRATVSFRVPAAAARRIWEADECCRKRNADDRRLWELERSGELDDLASD